jgi:hypothetical protein
MAQSRGSKPQKRLIKKTPVQGAERHEVEDFAHGLSISHLHCRELGHNWRPWVARYDEEHSSYERALRCTRCRTERWESIGLSGTKLGSHYKYPDGYVAPAGLGRIVGEGRDALRLESLHRSITQVDAKSQAS